MEKAALIKNAVILLGVILLGSAGYYLYLQEGDLLVGLADEDMTAQLERESRSFIARQNEIRKINLRTELFADTRFTTLRSNSTPVPTLQTGRRNPFESINFFITNTENATLNSGSGNTP